MNPIRAEVVDPVSESLEKQIEAYLASVPEYAAFPFVHFYVQTNNSFERVNFLDKAWAFLPIGNEEMPLMFACDTGYGDGTYDVVCDYCGAVPCGLSIAFLEAPLP